MRSVRAGRPAESSGPAAAPGRAVIELTADVAAFAREAGPLLRARIERNVLATVLAGIVEGRFADPPPWFALVRGDHGHLRGVALRTPPRTLLCTALDADDARELMAAWLRRDPGVSGASADPDTARALAAAWTAATGGTTRLDTAMALHVADAITDPPRPAPGILARADSAQLGRVVAWWGAFERDVDVGPRAPGEAAIAARAAVAAGRAFLWEDAGEPVSLVSHSPAVAGVPRLGPVYTPPAHRRRGYAGTAVAQLSRRLLVAGAPRCMLFTDLANPTANRIYAEVGYRRVGDWEEHGFSPPEDRAADGP